MLPESLGVEFKHEIIKLILNKASKFDEKGSIKHYEITPLTYLCHLATANKYEEKITNLLNNGADPNVNIKINEFTGTIFQYI